MKGTENQHAEQDQDLLEELFRNVSSRERPSREQEQAVRAALHAQWKQATRRRRIRRMVFAFATAASVILAVVLGLGFLRGPVAPESVVELAHVEKSIGRAVITSASVTTRPLVAAAKLGAGQRISTSGGSRLAIRWMSGESVRLDENTQINLVSSQEIELTDGKIYLDTDRAGPNSSLVIRTPGGVVRHLGTRYLAAIHGDGISISVRDGRVKLQSEDIEAEAGAGEQMNLDASGNYQLDTISTYGPMWQWAESVAPAFASDGRPLAEFLAWVAKESGRELVYDSVEAEQVALQTVLRGQLDLEPVKALNVMTQTSDLESELSAGALVISLR